MVMVSYSLDFEGVKAEYWGSFSTPVSVSESLGDSAF
jgi:hypothetical protein